MVEKRDPDERVAIPLDPEEALRALLKVAPESKPVAPDGREEHEDRPPSGSTTSVETT
jgi:hypothetical protein